MGWDDTVSDATGKRCSWGGMPWVELNKHRAPAKPPGKPGSGGRSPVVKTRVGAG